MSGPWTQYQQAGQEEEQRAPWETFGPVPEAAPRTRTGTTAFTPMSPFQLPSTAGMERAGVSPEEAVQAQQVDFRRTEALPIGAGGFAGAAAGAKVGAVFGVPGMLAGAVIGGAAGAYGGSLAADYLNQEDFDHAKATREAGIDAGFNMAGMAITSRFRPGYYAVKKALGFGPKETAEDILRLAERGTAFGSPESLRASQYLLSEGGATFTPFQTGLASNLQNFNERVARVGIFSSNVIEENMRAQSNVVRRELDEMLARMNVTGDVTSEELGAVLYRVIQDGNSALQTTYGRGLDELGTQIVGRTVPTAPLRTSLQQFLESGTRTSTGEAYALGNTLDPRTLEFVKDKIRRLDRAGPQINASSLIEFEKELQTAIFQAGEVGNTAFNTTVSRQLGILADDVRQSTVNTFRTINDDVAGQFVALKRSYSDAKGSLLPRINASFIRAADRGNYNSLGKMLIGGGSADQVNALFRSIDESFAQAARAGTAIDGATSAEAAKNLVRQGFIQQKLPNLSELTDVRQYANLAREIERTGQAGKYRAVLGEHYPTFKQLINILAESTTSPRSNIGELMIRSKEYASISGGLQVGAAVVNPLGVAGAAAILYSPVVLAKMSTNPQTVNRMLAFEKRRFTSQEAMNVAATNLVADIMRLLPEEDREEIRQYTRLLESGME